MKKITQQQLEKKTGIKQPVLSEIENDKRNPSLKMLERIAKGLGCNVRDLLNDSSN